MKQSFLLFFALLSLAITACTQPRVQAPQAAQNQTLNPLQSTTYMESHDKVVKTEEEWKAELSQEQYYVCRQAGTERPFDNAYWNNHEKGTYYCVACGQALFKSDTKFESGSGWPSFFSPFSKEALIIKVDQSHGMRREEVECSKCHSHLGHVFPDGPKPTGLRYCMNSAAMKFTKEE